MTPATRAVIGFSLLCLCGCRQPAPSSIVERAPSAIHVGPNVHVSADMPAWEHTEYMADADPGDANRLMLCSMYSSQEQNQLASGVYTSTDGGRSWTLTENDTSVRFGGVWDPACAFGANGDAWFITIATDFTRPYPSDVEEGTFAAWKAPARSRMVVYRSTDRGVTWARSTEFGFVDNEDITIDRTSGTFAGRIYVYGNTFPWTSLWLVYSADGGKTFVQSSETKLASGQAIHAGPGAVAPDGALLLPYQMYADRDAQTRGQSSIAVAVSTDGGAHLGRPVVVAPQFECRRMKDANTRDMASSAGPSTVNVVIDHSGGPFNGRAYVEWMSMDRNQCAVFVSHSDDGGKKWSQAVKVSDAPFAAGDGPDAFLPELAVNTSGVVAATWYDRREALNQKDHRLRVSASLDGGDTWMPSEPVSTNAFVYTPTPEWRASAQAIGGGRRTRPEAERTDMFETLVFPGARLYDAWNHGMGDYAAMTAAADGRFHAFWIDNRTGVAQMYTSAITVDGAASALGSPELDGLENISTFVEVQYTTAVFNPETRTLDLGFQMLNTSTRTLFGPMKMRFLGMTSDFGPPTVVTADGRATGAGALVDVSTTVPAEGLAPGATSGIARVTLRFAPGQVTLNPRGNTDIARLRSRLFGTMRR
jgi:hypothetical protein